jgi:PAS domain S-box-containing protein
MSNDKLPKSGTQMRSLLIVGLFCSNVLVLVLTILSLSQSREQYEQRAETITQTVASAVDQTLSASIQKIDLTLRAAADELERQLAGKGIDEAAMTVLFSKHEQRLPEVEAFRVSNAEGLVILGKGLVKAERASWADREYFKYHRDHADHVLQVTKPRMGRVAKQYIVGFSQRYNYPDGSFAGVISAPIALSHLEKILAGYDVGPHGTVVLRDAGYGQVARFPAKPGQSFDQVGHKVISKELTQLLDSGVQAATYHTAATPDGVERTLSLRRLATGSMIVNVGVSSDDYLSNWRTEVYMTSALAGGFMLLSLVLGGFLLRLLAEAEKREAALKQHHDHLEELVEQRTTALLATEARASHILESSADGLYGVDRSGIITFINPAACAMLGYRAEDVIGRPGHKQFHHSKPDGSPYPVSECPSHNALQVGQEVRVDNEVYWHADGHPVPVMYAIHPVIQEGLTTGAVISFVDMSEQRAAAQARERALLAAENLARVRSEFLANMSHEIRTPLNGVLGFAEIGQRNYQNPEKALGAFQKIVASGTRLLGVINDILDFSKIEAGKMSIEQTEVNLVELVENTVELVRNRAEAKQLSLQVNMAVDLPKTCISDPLRIGQVLLNILNNAVKFTEQGGVSLTLSRQVDQLVFTVVDSGIGMDESQLDELFSPFQQADASATRRFGGTGLGLAISKRILDLMNGRITVRSAPGVGSTFEFRVPYVASLPRVTKDSTGGADNPSLSSKPLAGISFLCAEDEPINQAILEENLLEDGASVVMVSNGREAVERILQDGRDAYDIVLMDLQMPEMDGYEASRRILELAPDLPIIAQTAHAFREEIERCLSAGMIAHIAKPIDPDALVRLVQQHVVARSKMANAL